MKLKTTVLTIYLFTLFTANIYSQEKIQGIVGSWDSVARSKYGIGAIWQFYNDGKLDVINAAMIDYLYILENDTLITVQFDHQTGESKADTSVLKINNNTLTQTQFANGETYVKKLERVGKIVNKNKQELGLWKGKNSAGQEMTFRFTKDHQFLFRVQFEKKSGKYNLLGIVLTTEFKNEKAGVWEVNFVGKTMKLNNNNSATELIFKRSE